MKVKEINLFGDITDESVIGCIKEIQEHLESESEKATDSRKDICINVYSDGGNIDAMLALCDIIEDVNKNKDTIKIHTHILRKAYSAGFPIWLCGFERTISKSAEAMYHDMLYGYFGPKEEHKDYLARSNDVGDMVDRIIIDNYKITNEELDKIKKSRREHYIKGEDLIKNLKIGYRRYKK